MLCGKKEVNLIMAPGFGGRNVLRLNKKYFTQITSLGLSVNSNVSLILLIYIHDDQPIKIILSLSINHPSTGKNDHLRHYMPLLVQFYLPIANIIFLVSRLEQMIVLRTKSNHHALAACTTTNGRQILKCLEMGINFHNFPLKSVHVGVCTPVLLTTNKLKF